MKRRLQVAGKRYCEYPDGSGGYRMCPYVEMRGRAAYCELYELDLKCREWQPKGMYYPEYRPLRCEQCRERGDKVFIEVVWQKEDDNG